VVTKCHRVIFAKAKNVEPYRFNAGADEILPDGGGSALAQGKIVLASAALVAVSSHEQIDIWRNGFEVGDERVKFGSFTSLHHGAVEVEVNRVVFVCFKVLWTGGDFSEWFWRGNLNGWLLTPRSQAEDDYEPGKDDEQEGFAFARHVWVF
jgi:hypothetical protein